jgi:hypothetical protein
MRTFRTRSYDPALLLLLVLSLGLNAYLSWRVRGGGAPPVKNARPALVEEGTRLPVLEGKSTEDQSMRVGFDIGRPTLLYVFSADCRWCLRNAENIKSLARQRSSGYRFLGLAVRGDRTSVAKDQADLGFDVLREPTVATTQALRLGPTPMTILVSTSGAVVRVWTGAYDGRVADDMRRFFDVRLPGLTREQVASHEASLVPQD